MTLETALPEQGQPAPEASGQPDDAALHQDPPGDGQQADDGQGDAAEAKKPEKSPEQREIERLRRGIDRRTRQLAEERARNAARPAEQARADDSEPLTLSRAELAQMVNDEAQRLAPTLQSQQAETERRQGVIQSLAKTWGQERFDEIASDLDDALGGLADRTGRPKPAVEAVFEADNPAAVIEYLADPDNLDEAEAIARMSAAQAGRAVARLEDKLAAKGAKAKPQASKAPAPLTALRGQGGTSQAPDPTDTKAWIRWRNEQERKGL